MGVQSDTAVPAKIGKTIVSLHIKPWDDTTNMAALEASVKAIEKPGLVWGASELVPVGYGITMLQINVVVEDSVGIDDLGEEIVETCGEWVQSCDNAAMQKL